MSLPDLPDILEQEFCNAGTTNSKHFVSISQSIALREEEKPNKNMLPPIETMPMYKTETVPPTLTVSASFPRKPVFNHSDVRRLDQTPKFLRLQTDLRRASVQQLSFMVSGQSVRDVVNKDKTPQPKWKTGCLCMRCDMIQQQYKDRDMNAYNMWGKYPCNHPEAACEADSNQA